VAGAGIYSATKFAIEAISEALHDELRPLGIHVTVVEPGYFGTDLHDAASLSISARGIADYNGPAAVARLAAHRLIQSQPGDPAKLAEVIVALADAPNPPLRLPLGSDSIAAIEAKHQADATIIRNWREISVSTDI
jgi:NAD(P)-dependent dehydrogenase (short-subunit alcohol dehydrogenase family)